MRIHSHRWYWLGVASLWALCGCGGGGSDPSPATSAGVTATVASYLDALRRDDVTGVRAALAPEYDYDDVTPEKINLFEGPLTLSYRSLSYRLETLTTSGNRATALLVIVFQANVNLEFFNLGRPPLNGRARYDM